MLTKEELSILDKRLLNIQALDDMFQLKKTWGIADTPMLVALAYNLGEMRGIRKERARRK